MTRLIAFLRAINVGGHTVTMDKLRKEFEALGLMEVETFIASGNVIFTPRSLDVVALEKKIEARLRASLGYEVATFVRTDAANAGSTVSSSHCLSTLSSIVSRLRVDVMM